MKKLISLLLCISILVAALPAFATTATAATTAETPLLKVGIMSDTQITSTSDAGMTAAVNALKNMKKKGVELIIHAGDIADANPSQVYPYYLQKINEIFPDGVQHLEIPGNHDIWSDNTLSIYEQYFGSKNKHITVNGFHFIGISSDNTLGTATNGNYGTTSKNYAKTQMASAVTSGGTDKPFFVITHQHVSDTVWGSYPANGSDGWGNNFLWGIIDQYQNAVHFSGHSHYVLDDERSIWQGDFTAIGTSSLSYTELDYGYANCSNSNHSTPPNAHLAKQYLIMSIYSDRIEIERIKESTGKSLKNNWVLDLPLNKSEFKYTEARAEDRTTPYFPENATASYDVVGNNNMTFTFTAAKHDDFVHSYRLKFYKDGSLLNDDLIYSDFYLGVSSMAATVSYSYYSVYEPYHTYRFEAYPIESYGKTGEPLIYSFATIPKVNIQKQNKLSQLQLDFTTGKVRNLLSGADVEVSGGSVSYDEDGLAYYSGGMIYTGPAIAHFTLMGSKFTQEIVFKAKDFKTVQDLMTCYSNGGTRIWLDTDGKLHATVNNSAKTDVDVATPALTAGQLTDAVVTYDGAALTIYINGAKAASTPLTGKVNFNRTMRFAYGGSLAKTNLFSGAIYTAGNQSAVLSADTIKANYDEIVASVDLQVRVPLMEQVRRMEMLTAENSGNETLKTVFDYYRQEVEPFAHYLYTTEKLATAVISGRDVDADITTIGGNTVSDYDKPVISGVAHGGEYILSATAPVATFTNCYKATLDGEPYTEGTPIGAGQHVLLAYNGWRITAAKFTVKKLTTPVVSGIENGKLYNLRADGARKITWTPESLTATLDNVAYTADTEVSSLGWHTLVITADSKNYIYAFKLLDFLSFDLDGDEELTVTDALSALRFAVGLSTPTADELFIADCDGDGEFTISDALIILRKAAGFLA